MVIVGVRGSREIVAVVAIARGSVDCVEVRRHGVVPIGLFGAIVRAAA